MSRDLIRKHNNNKINLKYVLWSVVDKEFYR